MSPASKSRADLFKVTQSRKIKIGSFYAAQHLKKNPWPTQYLQESEPLKLSELQIEHFSIWCYFSSNFPTNPNQPKTDLLAMPLSGGYMCSSQNCQPMARTDGTVQDHVLQQVTKPMTRPQGASFHDIRFPLFPEDCFCSEAPRQKFPCIYIMYTFSHSEYPAPQFQVCSA